MTERTFVMVKPDGVRRGLVGEVIKRIEQKGLKIVAMKMVRLSEETAKEHYAEHVNKPFFPSLVEFITSGPVVSMVVEGNSAIEVMRRLCGATNPIESPPGTIRGDFGLDIGENIVHASDSPHSAEKEISIHFSNEEIIDY
jgi:nucleoside-diphosphate kinase